MEDRSLAEPFRAARSARPASTSGAPHESPRLARLRPAPPRRAPPMRYPVFGSNIFKYSGQQPETNSGNRIADKPPVASASPPREPPVVFRFPVCMGFSASVPLKNRPGRLSSLGAPLRLALVPPHSASPRPA